MKGQSNSFNHALHPGVVLEATNYINASGLVANMPPSYNVKFEQLEAQLTWRSLCDYVLNHHAKFANQLRIEIDH